MEYREPYPSGPFVKPMTIRVPKDEQFTRIKEDTSMIGFGNYSLRQLAEMTCDFQYAKVMFNSGTTTYEYIVPKGLDVNKDDLVVVDTSSSVEMTGAAIGPMNKLVVVKVVEVTDSPTVDKEHKFILSKLDSDDFFKSSALIDEVSGFIRTEQQVSLKKTIMQSIRAQIPGIDTILNKIEGTTTTEAKE